MSFSRVQSAALWGMEVIPVQVEADVSNGLPLFHMVGYLSAEVREAGERVRTAMHNSGFVIPAKKTVVNLSPGDVRKRGTSYDLPIALAVLAALGNIEETALSGVLAVGELGLDGGIRGVPGVLPIAGRARELGVRCLIVPEVNEPEARLISDLPVLGASCLKELCDRLSGQELIGTVKPAAQEKFPPGETDCGDFAEIRGQEAVRRAAEIAAAGRHNLLMIGPPGGGKSMIARRIPGILPALSREESMQITRVYSIAGLLKPQDPLITGRPFREVHQTATRTSLIGGGAWPRPGELSLASGGVLFLDELPEFQRQVLEALRQPLEERRVRITRSQGTCEYPADVMLVAAMNPCPCGYYPDYNRCSCTPFQIRQYQSKISHPFLGRMDLCVEAPGVRYEELKGSAARESSAEIRKRVWQAGEIQMARNKGHRIYNAQLAGKALEEACRLGRKEERMMSQAFDAFSLNARTYHRVLRVARTIADLEGEERIRLEHLQEALVYRSIDQKYWGKLL